MIKDRHEQARAMKRAEKLMENPKNPRWYIAERTGISEYMLRKIWGPEDPMRRKWHIRLRREIRKGHSAGEPKASMCRRLGLDPQDLEKIAGRIETNYSYIFEIVG